MNAGIISKAQIFYELQQQLVIGFMPSQQKIDTQTLALSICINTI